jgi:hypothetical protein
MSPTIVAAAATATTALTPTTQLSIKPPEFNMQQPPKPRKQQPPSSSAETRSSSPSSSSKGQLHVKLIQARGLNVRSLHARPYIVVQFEQSEFISRGPTSEQEKEVKGVPVALSRNPSSSALTALGAITKSKPYEMSAARANKPLTTSSHTPPSSTSNGHQSHHTSSASSSGHLLGHSSPHNPIWKHKVTLYVVHTHAFMHTYKSIYAVM